MRWGVSNFDAHDMAALDGSAVASNQVLYNLSRRGIEFDLLPWCRTRGIPVMAYSPIEQGRILGNRTLNALAKARGCSAAQIALAWVLQPGRRADDPQSHRSGACPREPAALDIRLSAEECTVLDKNFPPPRKSAPLGML